MCPAEGHEVEGHGAQGTPLCMDQAGLSEEIEVMLPQGCLLLLHPLPRLALHCGRCKSRPAAPTSTLRCPPQTACRSPPRPNLVARFRRNAVHLRFRRNVLDTRHPHLSLLSLLTSPTGCVGPMETCCRGDVCLVGAPGPHQGPGSPRDHHCLLRTLEVEPGGFGGQEGRAGVPRRFLAARGRGIRRRSALEGGGCGRRDRVLSWDRCRGPKDCGVRLRRPERGEGRRRAVAPPCLDGDWRGNAIVVRATTTRSWYRITALDASPGDRGAELHIG